ncbi:hypothetical protein [Glycomyces terrestris]|uniref:Uncharacterized protein n=1 Tax=Glycomyces terrestris TaxID=2493553 RepID=A0A426UY51_9ACTN|nr:hypothetical protein [Glycomyces terrestris]RRR99495.1 hypothetical protein EIW28_12380 [Glycomyces terrestris]
MVSWTRNGSASTGSVHDDSASPPGHGTAPYRHAAVAPGGGSGAKDAGPPSRGRHPVTAWTRTGSDQRPPGGSGCSAETRRLM